MIRIFVSAKLRTLLVKLGWNSLLSYWVWSKLILDAHDGCNSIHIGIPIIKIALKIKWSFKWILSWIYFWMSLVWVVEKVKFVSTIRESSFDWWKIDIKAYSLIKSWIFILKKYADRSSMWCIFFLFELWFKKHFLIHVLNSFFLQKPVCIFNFLSFSFKFLSESFSNSSSFLISILLDLLLNLHQFFNLLFLLFLFSS